MKKKVLAIVTAALIGTTAFAATASAASGTIDVISREDGSGTRGAFIELFGIEEKQGDEKVDMTTEDASITNSTSVMMTTVAGDENAIGYISLGSLNDTVKAVKIDGAEASAENVANDTYKVSRPFNIITTDKLSDAAQDFENYIMSADGQQIVEDNGYIKVADDAKAYEQSDAEGKVVVAGSSSVTPVMEKLKEAYEKANGGKITVEVQQSDSTTGITSAAEGICDIGMASRELKDEEAKFFHLGSLLSDDFSLDVVKLLSGKGKLAVDAQGYLREVRGEQVYPTDWKDKREALKYIDILKVNEHEAEVLTGFKDFKQAALQLAEWGVKEVLLTLGSLGSIIYAESTFYKIPAYPAKNVVDATGCGDTYSMGYLYMRNKGASYEEAGCFAAALSTIKLEKSGPFSGTEEQVWDII